MSRRPTDLYRYPPFKLRDRIEKIGHVNVSPILEWLNSKPQELWLENDMRQTNPRLKVHKDTESIIFKWSENNSVNTPVETTDIYTEFEPLITPILRKIQNYYGYSQPVIRKIMLAKLKAGGTIPRHIDGARALKMVHRIHIPIKINRDVHFYIDDADHQFKVGDIIEIDNVRPHSVENKSNTDRIHLIIDYYHLIDGPTNNPL